MKTYFLGQIKEPDIFVPVANLVPSDDGCGIFKYSISGDSSNIFYIKDDTLFIKNAPPFGNHDVDIYLNDPLGRFPAISNSFSISVAKHYCLNCPPLGGPPSSCPGDYTIIVNQFGCPEWACLPTTTTATPTTTTATPTTTTATPTTTTAAPTTTTATPTTTTAAPTTTTATPTTTTTTTTTTTCPPTPIPVCAPGSVLVTTYDENGCPSYSCETTTTTSSPPTTTTTATPTTTTATPTTTTETPTTTTETPTTTTATPTTTTATPEGIGQCQWIFNGDPAVYSWEFLGYVNVSYCECGDPPDRYGEDGEIYTYPCMGG